MMTLAQIIQALDLRTVTTGEALDRTVEGGYASDLLSCVMSHAKERTLWVTLQAHVNVIAVASLLGLAAVLITEGQQPDAEMLERAETMGVVLLTTPKSTFTIVSELAALGVQGEPVGSA